MSLFTNYLKNENKKGVEVRSVGINEIMAPEAKIYPNPVSDILKVEILQSTKKLEMMNLYGQLIFTRSISRNESFTIDMSSLAPGIYLLRLSGNGNVVKNYKVIRQ